MTYPFPVILQSKQKYDAQSEDWERAILAQSSNDADHLPKKTLFKSNKTPAQVRDQNRGGKKTKNNFIKEIILGDS